MPLLPGGLRRGGREEEVATAVRAPTTPHYTGTAPRAAYLKHSATAQKFTLSTLHRDLLHCRAPRSQCTPAIGKLGPPCKGGLEYSGKSGVYFVPKISGQQMDCLLCVYEYLVGFNLKVNHTWNSGLRLNVTSQVFSSSKIFSVGDTKNWPTVEKFSCPQMFTILETGILD